MLVMGMYKILLIEDEFKIREELACFLKNNGFEVLIIDEFENTLNDILKAKVDLILMDINIPGINGMRLCKEVRKSKNIPIIVVTSRNSEMDEVISLNYGADDFITKPYNPQVLIAHIEAALRRKSSGNSFLEYNGMMIDHFKGLIEYNGKNILLTKNELSILSYLINHRGCVVSRDDLMRYLWDSEMFVDDNTLTVNITRIRRKLEEIGLKNVIETRRGWGYIIL